MNPFFFDFLLEMSKVEVFRFRSRSRSRDFPIFGPGPGAGPADFLKLVPVPVPVPVLWSRENEHFSKKKSEKLGKIEMVVKMSTFLGFVK